MWIFYELSCYLNLSISNHDKMHGPEKFENFFLKQNKPHFPVLNLISGIKRYGSVDKITLQIGQKTQYFIRTGSVKRNDF